MSNMTVGAIISEDAASNGGFKPDTVPSFIAATIISVLLLLLWVVCSFYGKRQERRRMRKLRDLLRLRGVRSECMDCEAGARACLPDLLHRQEVTETTQV